VRDATSEPQRENLFRLAHSAEEGAPTNARRAPARSMNIRRATSSSSKRKSISWRQNTVLLERIKETKVLTAQLQQLLAPLLKAPECSEEGREETQL
jgi:hypothetical protein